MIRSKKLIVLSLAALMGAASIPAFAQQADEPPAGMSQGDDMQVAERDGHRGRDGKGHHGRGEHGGRHMRMMIDANGDGVIGDDEAAALADHAFNRIDRDDSGDISAEEFSTLRGGRGWFNWGAQGEAISDGLKAKFATLDANKDSKLTKVEFLADAQARFASADTDKDGKVSPWEFRAQN